MPPAAGHITFGMRSRGACWEWTIPADTRAFRSTRRGSVFLVRPDGYLAARPRPDKPDTVLGYLQELFRSETEKSGEMLDRREQPV